ncbi:MAG: ATP-binding protein [Nostoc sp.]|uniref:ATP-binding protein n=1 Tax=Nostoc sp. TaxID=1180 RepID=UPI002FFD4ECE
MSFWQTFLVMDVCRQYGLSHKEQEILLAKFPDENTVNSNNQVADQSLENKQLPDIAETVRRQMWTIYNKRFAPQQDPEIFLELNQKNGKSKDIKFLAWLRNKYLQWLETQNFKMIDSVQTYTDNPFTPLNDIINDQHLLYGRERDITRIFETLNSGSSVALIGEKKIGKSSLLKAIYHQAQHRLNKPRKAIYLNLSLIFNDDDFYDKLCEQVNIPVQRGRQLIRNLEQQQLLLLLDEVERMTWKGFTRDLRLQLRGLADGQANPPLRLVITASEHLDVLFPDSRDNPSPFQGVCIEEIIHPWDENIVRGFIHNRLMNTQVSFIEEEIIQLIIEPIWYLIYR